MATAFDLAAGGSYKLFIQPHETGFPDQWHGGADFAAATTILLDANKTVTSAWPPTPPPTSFTLSGTVSTSGGPLAGAEVYRVRRGQRRLRQERP